MQTVAETSLFAKQADRLLDHDQRDALIRFLAANPEAGDQIPETGGVRKLRFGAKGKGKRGGVRVIYYFYNETVPLYALLIFGKNQKTDLAPDEKKAVRAFVEALKATFRKPRKPRRGK